MKRTDVVVIGGGQAGLAASFSLGEQGLEHVVLERGFVAERWRSERWDSLTLLTPRWQSRLPGWSYRGPDPHGYMTRAEVVRYLTSYARAFVAPVQQGVTVTSVARDGTGYRVETDAGVWWARGVVIATGHSDRPRVPGLASALPGWITQVVPPSYRNPDALPPGGVLVVGASATGVQLAAELQASGRPVTLAVGRHSRVPRRYRGRDVLWWMDQAGLLTEPASGVRDLAAARGLPSLQLVGAPDQRNVDLVALQAMGVRLVGRVTGVDGRRVMLADDLVDSVADAELRLARLLARLDAHVARGGLAVPAAEPLPPLQPTPAVPTIDLASERIATVLWATGYQRSYPWLKVPVLDARGEIIHDGGVTPAAGLYVLGLSWLRRRNSTFLDGVGADARELAGHLAAHLRARLAA